MNLSMLAIITHNNTMLRRGLLAGAHYSEPKKPAENPEHANLGSTLSRIKRMTERAIVLQRYERGETPESIATHLGWAVRQVRNLLVLRGVWKGE